MASENANEWLLENAVARWKVEAMAPDDTITTRLSTIAEWLESFAASRLAGAEQRIAELEADNKRLMFAMRSAESRLAEARQALEQSNALLCRLWMSYDVNSDTANVIHEQRVRNQAALEGKR